MNQYISKAFVYHSPGDVRLEELNIDCSPTDIVVKIMASARCGTDRTIFYEGHPKVDPRAPIVLGHEFLGEIVEVGKEVMRLKDGIGFKEGKRLSNKYLDFKVGQKVTTQSRIARYRDGLMLLDRPITILSFYINGAYSQYMKIPKELVLSGSILRIPDGVSDEDAVLVEPAACALESIFSTPHPRRLDEEGRHFFRGGIKKDGLSLIIGSGSVSMIYARLCQIENAKKVFILVRSEEKAALAKEILGEDIVPVINPSYGGKSISEKQKIEDGLVKDLKDATNGHLFDDVILACSDADAQRLMLKLYNPNGYSVGACFGGTHRKADKVDMDQHHYRSAKTIGSSGCSTKTMETILSWLKEGKLSLKGFLSSQKYSLATDPKEFFTTKANGLKPVLYPWDQSLPENHSSFK
ncbi:hypothetical protein LCGC14_1581530 [marine sediment metagenome]|uniref:Uncharacterized protein n=1 Tax=marine sediment metagenome TaxID=412755 RepID=A0A0F9IGQ3_9ZZZZ